MTSQVVSVGHLTGAWTGPKVTLMMPSALNSRDPFRTTVWPATPDEGETVITSGALPEVPSACRGTTGRAGVVGTGRVVDGTEELDDAVVAEGALTGDRRAVAGAGAFPVGPANLGWGDPLGRVRKNTAIAAKTRTPRAAAARAGALDGPRGLSPP